MNIKDELVPGLEEQELTMSRTELPLQPLRK